MPATNYTKRAFLAGLFQKTTGANFGQFASPPTLYIALYTVTPAEDGTGGTEVSTGSYARIATVAADWTNPTDADPSVVDNVNVEQFTSNSDWGSITIVGFGLVDAATAGNILWAGSMTSKPVTNGDTVEFQVGELNIQIT